MLKSMIGAVVGTVFLAKAMTGNAADLDSVFGLRMQQPLAIPQCRYEVQDGKAFYVPPRAGACYELTFGDGPGEVDDLTRMSSAPPTDGPVVIVWEEADKPEIVAGRGAMAVMAGGKLERMVFKTRGVSAQDAVYHTLVDQFGAATSTLKAPCQVDNTMTLPLLAKWTLDRLDVLFYSAAEGVERGVVSISAHPSTQLSSNAATSPNDRTPS